MSITKFLAGKITNYNNPKSVASRLRARRFLLMKSMIEDVFKEKSSVRIIDIGGTQTYWNILQKKYLEEKNVNIVIVNLSGTSMPHNDKLFTFVVADGCALNDFQNKSFDIAHSNSVIEHVGDWNRMIQFAREISRVAERYFVQTPNYWFPIEPHCMTPFFHWLPKPTRICLVSSFSLGHWRKAASIREAVTIVESANLLTRKMMKALFPDAYIFTERFLGLPKSIVATKNNSLIG